MTGSSGSPQIVRSTIRSHRCQGIFSDDRRYCRAAVQIVGVLSGLTSPYAINPILFHKSASSSLQAPESGARLAHGSGIQAGLVPGG